MSWARIRTEVREGREVVVKDTTYDAGLEAEGIRALGDAGARVPRLLEVGANRLVMERVSGNPDWEQLGRELAAVHRRLGPHFGWRRDNVIGDRPQENPDTSDWAAFYIDHRLRPWLSCLPIDLARRLDHAMSTVLPDVLNHDAVPSLIHGDLWSGNVIDGCWLIDPAVSWSDREVELAFAGLFGGIPDRFFSAYAQSWPLDHGWEERRPALQLYHALIHVDIFGDRYLGMVSQRVDRYA